MFTIKLLIMVLLDIRDPLFLKHIIFVQKVVSYVLQNKLVVSPVLYFRDLFCLASK